MKSSIARALLVPATASALALAAIQAHASSCSPANTAGDWAYTYTGTIFTQNGPVPAAAVGHYHQDAAGNITGSQTRSVGGKSAVEDISGTVSVNRDCTTTATIEVLVNGQVQRTAVLAGVVDNDRNHVRSIFESLTLSDSTTVPVVLTSDAQKLFPRD
jgi:hypothetical protein